MTSPLVLVAHDERTRALKCFYMTALPGLYTASAVDVFSMDGPGIYAPEFHRLPFLRAVEHDLFSDYNVVVLALSEQHVDGPCRAHLASAGGERPQRRRQDHRLLVRAQFRDFEATRAEVLAPRTDQTTSRFGYEQLLSGACNSRPRRAQQLHDGRVRRG